MAYYFRVLARVTQPEMYPPQWRTGPPRRRREAVPPPAPNVPPSDLWEAVTVEARQLMTRENVERWFVLAR